MFNLKPEKATIIKKQKSNVFE